MTELKAIETVYNGYKFRSRLEARWAVFFDYLKIKYQYEFEGFDLGEAGWYLPDFCLVEDRVYVEIKPALNLITSEEKLKITAMIKVINNGWKTKTESELDTFPRYLMLLVGSPDVPWQDGEGGNSVKRLLKALDIGWRSSRDSILVSEAVKAARQARF